MAVIPYLSKLAWGGTHSTSDEWSCSLHTHRTAIPTEDPAIFKTALTAWMNRTGSGLPTSSTLEYIKWNVIDPLSGRYASKDLARTAFVSPAVGGALSAGLPQQTLCITLATAAQRGRGHAGRTFPPSGAGFAFGNDGKLTQAAVLAAATSFAQLLNEIRTAGVSDIVVFSKIAQTITKVTSVRVGRVMDTQRRRRSSIDEEYQTVTLAP